MASPEPVKEALQVFEEKLNELEALLFEEVTKDEGFPSSFVTCYFVDICRKIRQIFFLVSKLEGSFTVY